MNIDAVEAVRGLFTALRLEDGFDELESVHGDGVVPEELVVRLFDSIHFDLRHSQVMTHVKVDPALAYLVDSALGDEVG